jgi:two-component system phosphate regulon response regulator PhoB
MEVAAVTAPTIAIVDDDAELLDLLGMVLGDQGWGVLAFTDSTAALALLAEAPPTIIMLDLRFGSIRSGWDVLQEVRKTPALETIPVILCSGDIEHLREKEEWLAEQGIGVLPKPFDLDVLDATLEGALKGSVKVLTPV